MKELEQLIDRLPQWKDGLLSDGEILGYALNGMAAVYAALHDIRENIEAKERNNYWWRLQHAQDDQWIDIKGMPVVGMTIEQAKRLNKAFTNQRFHSDYPYRQRGTE